MNKKFYWIVLAAIAVVVIGLIFVIRQAKTSRNVPVFRTEMAETTGIEKVVSGSGNIEYVSKYDLVSPDTGVINSLSIKDMESIKTGQELFRVNGNPVYALNGTTPIYRNLRYGDSGDDVKVLQSSLKELSYDIDEIDGDFGSDTRSALKDFQEDKELSETGILNFANFQAFPLPSNVVNLPVKQGDRLNAGQAVAVFADTDKLKVDVLVNEIDIPKVKVGQQTLITVDALPKEKFSGKVSFVSEMPSDSSSTQQNSSQSSGTGVVSYKVEILFDKVSSDVKAGMTANADIVIEKKDSALVVPSAAVAEREGKKFVRIVGTDGMPREVEVTIGITSDEKTEILSGLNEGNRVVIGTEGFGVSTQGTRQQTSGTGGPPRGFMGGPRGGFRPPSR